MPTLRKLTPEEVAVYEKQGEGLRAQIAAEYDQLLADINAGEHAVVTLDDDENKATTRNRLKAAAARRNLAIIFFRTRDNSVKFKLEETGGTVEQEEVVEEAAA